MIANWSKDGSIERGIKLQKNKVAYCGSWKNDQYNGNGVYIGEDLSVYDG